MIRITRFPRQHWFLILREAEKCLTDAKIYLLLGAGILSLELPSRISARVAVTIAPNRKIDEV